MENEQEFAQLLRSMTDDQFARFMQAAGRDLAELHAPQELNPHKMLSVDTNGIVP